MQEKRFFLFCVGERKANLIRSLETGGAPSDVLRALQNRPLCKVTGRSGPIRRLCFPYVIWISKENNREEKTP